MSDIECAQSTPTEKRIDPRMELGALRLVALYAHVVDEREFARAHELFTDDAILDLRPIGGVLLQGAKAISDLWSDPSSNSLLHHATNALVDYVDENQLRVTFKGIGVGRNGRVGSALYRTVVRRMGDGWRFASMVVEIRKAGSQDQAES
jgi:hypothetical protein